MFARDVVSARKSLSFARNFIFRQEKFVVRQESSVRQKKFDVRQEVYFSPAKSLSFARKVVLAAGGR